MSIYVGTNEIKNVYVGTTPVKEIFVGTEKVRPALPIPLNGLLGYRPLEENLNDSSGNGKNASWYSGTGSFETASGKTGAKVTQNTSGGNKSTQHILTPLNYAGDNITYGGWINFYNYSGNYGQRPGLMNSTKSGASHYYCGLRPSDNLKFYSGWGAGTLVGSKPSLNTWYFYVTTIQGTDAKLYVNGSLVNSTTITSRGYSNDTEWRLGCGQYDGNSAAWGGTSGLVRHCFVYNRALTADEGLEIYNNTN